MPSTAKGEVPIRWLRTLNSTQRSPDPRCACPEKGTDSSLLAGQVSSTAHAVVPSPGLCALNRGQRRPHLRAVSPQTHMEVSPLEGRGPQLGMEGSRHALRAPWKTHRRVPTRGLTSSPAHGGLPTHGPCAFNHACSGPHHKPVRLQPPTQWFPLADSAPSSTQRGFPLTGHAPSTAHGWVLKAVGVPSTAHQEFPTCGLCTLNCARSGPHHRAMRSQLP